MLRTAVCLGLVGILLAPSRARAEADRCFDVMPQDGTISFEVEQAGTTFGGAFEKFGGTVCMSGDAVTSVNAWVEPASVDSGLPEMDTALQSAEFFGVEQHPRATFEGDRIEATDDGFVAHGSVEVKSIRKPLDVTFQLEPQGDAYRVTGCFELHRLEFDIGTGEWADTQWIGDVVTVNFRGELTTPQAPAK